MNKLDLMELLKNGGMSNVFDWLKYTKFISYGVVTDVIDAQTVLTAEIVKGSSSDNKCLATYLVPSSTLLEAAVLPRAGDLVLLLFLQKYHRSMFGLHRKTDDNIIYDRDAEGYNDSAAVALPLSPLKQNSSTMLLFGGTPELPKLSLNTLAEICAQFRGAASVFFDGEGDADTPVSLILGQKRPLLVDHRGTTRRKYGFVVDTVDLNLMETDATVNEEYSIYAPITRNIQGAQHTDVGIGTDPGGDPKGAPVETEAPVTETVHGKSPVTKDIRSPVSYTIGIGNAESGDDTEPRDAPVNFRLGERAPVTITSESGATLHFDKPVKMDGDETFDLTIDGKITITGGAQISLTAGTKIYLGNGSVDLYTLLTKLVDEIEKLVTFGQPGMHKVTPASKASLEAFKQSYIVPLLTASK
jgi:hypothetical protein